MLALVQEGVTVFLLIFVRIGTLLAIAPFWSSRTIPVQVRIFFGLVVSFVVFPLLWQDGPPGPWPLGQYIAMIFREFFVGMVLATVSSLLFSAIQIAGQIIDTQMGFGMVNVLDPQSGMQLPLMGNFFYFLALLLFLQVDGHHHLLMAVIMSFQMVPLGAGLFSLPLWYDLASLFGQVLVFSLRVALPAAGVLFLTDMAMGIIARTVPQMNVFVLGIPVKIILGTLTIVVLLPIYGSLLQLLFGEIFYNLDLLVEVLG